MGNVRRFEFKKNVILLVILAGVLMGCSDREVIESASRHFPQIPPPSVSPPETEPPFPEFKFEGLVGVAEGVNYPVSNSRVTVPLRTDIDRSGYVKILLSFCPMTEVVLVLTFLDSAPTFTQNVPATCEDGGIVFVPPYEALSRPFSLAVLLPQEDSSFQPRELIKRVAYALQVELGNPRVQNTLRILGTVGAPGSMSTGTAFTFNRTSFWNDYAEHLKIRTSYSIGCEEGTPTYYIERDVSALLYTGSTSLTLGANITEMHQQSSILVATNCLHLEVWGDGIPVALYNETLEIGLWGQHEGSGRVSVSRPTDSNLNIPTGPHGEDEMELTASVGSYQFQGTGTGRVRGIPYIINSFVNF